MKHLKLDKKQDLPGTLFHASAFNSDELMSGFKRTGKLVEWDQTESNEWLYATSDREEAINQGFASLLEKMYLLDRYQSQSGHILATFAKDQKPDLQEIKQKKIWLYRINSKNGGWVKNNNEVNRLDSEYKTQEVIRKQDFHVEEISVGDWLADKKFATNIRK